MAVAGDAAFPVAGFGGFAVGGGDEGPEPADGGEAVVLDRPAGDGDRAPDVRATGADPAYALSTRASEKRMRSSPISARTRAPVESARPGKLVMIA